MTHVKNMKEKRKTMLLAIMRHGQTHYNADKRVQGQIDIPLNDTGRKQAKNVGERLKAIDEHFDVIAASPLSRALESAYIIAKILDLNRPVVICHGFVERDFHHFDGMRVADAMPFVRKKGYRHEGYEDDAKLISRIVRTAKELDSRYGDQRVLMVAHSHVIKSLLIHFDQETYDFTEIIDNGDILYFNIEGETITYLKRLHIGSTPRS
jgi:uncharacterized phosphatase